MAHANGGAAGANEVLPQVDGAAVADGMAPQVNGAVLDGARVRRAVQVAAPVAGPLVAPVAGPLFPPGPAPARFDLDGVLLGPLPRKSNGSCEILPKIPVEVARESQLHEKKSPLG